MATTGQTYPGTVEADITPVTAAELDTTLDELLRDPNGFSTLYEIQKQLSDREGLGGLLELTTEGSQGEKIRVLRQDPNTDEFILDHPDSVPTKEELEERLNNAGTFVQEGSTIEFVDPLGRIRTLEGLREDQKASLAEQLVKLGFKPRESMTKLTQNRITANVPSAGGFAQGKMNNGQQVGNITQKRDYYTGPVIRNNGRIATGEEWRGDGVRRVR